jgi:hypothetical protein
MVSLRFLRLIHQTKNPLMQTLKCILLALFVQGILQAQTLLYDDFNDGTVNSELWSVLLPFSQSQVTESGGFLTSTGRGTLATVGSFSGIYALSGTVILNHYWENFNICIRSDLAQFNSYWERMGIAVDFHNAYDVQAQGVPGISISERTPSGSTICAFGDFTFVVGQPYEFMITDIGDSVTLFIDGIERLTAATTYSSGDRIALYSREFSVTSSSLDWVRIEAVPEPLTVSILGVAVLFAVPLARRSLFTA